MQHTERFSPSPLFGAHAKLALLLWQAAALLTACGPSDDNPSATEHLGVFASALTQARPGGGTFGSACTRDEICQRV